MTPITRIRIDYADGSNDDIQPLLGDDTDAPLYRWRRTRSTYLLCAGAYSIHAVAAFVFQTTLARELTDFDFEFDFRNPKTQSLMVTRPEASRPS